MARFLICCSPIHGHLAPLLRVTEGLIARRHDVVVLTGSRFKEIVERTGAAHLALPAGADFDDRDFDASFPGRAAKRGPARINFDASRVFGDPIPHQLAALRAILRDFPAEAVLVDPGFLGVMALLLDATTARPPVVSCNTSPLLLSSRDTAPFGFGLAPSSRALGRARNAALRFVVQRALLGPAQRHINQRLRSVGSPRLPVFFMDTPILADRVVQPTIDSFEYPRSDLPDKVRFVGPILPPPTARFDPPPWWPELDEDRPVVHVTQGTLDTGDLGRLIAPTLAALQHENVLVVATTGGRPSSAIPGPIPANARVETFVPYDHLLPKTDIIVTNGGYGGVQYALSHGVPLVVAGTTEDKPEVAARIAWAGVGINLRTAKPTVEKLREAILTVLSDASYRQRARALQAQCAQHDAVAEICEMLEQLATEHSTTSSTTDPSTRPPSRHLTGKAEQ